MYCFKKNMKILILMKYSLQKFSKYILKLSCIKNISSLRDYLIYNLRRVRRNIKIDYPPYVEVYYLICISERKVPEYAIRYISVDQSEL